MLSSFWLQLVLSSVHAVKGLECMVCFVVGLDTKAWRYLPCASSVVDLQQASLLLFGKWMNWMMWQNLTLKQPQLHLNSDEWLLWRHARRLDCLASGHAPSF